MKLDDFVRQLSEFNVKNPGYDVELQLDKYGKPIIAIGSYHEGPCSPYNNYPLYAIPLITDFEFHFHKEDRSMSLHQWDYSINWPNNPEEP